MTAAVPEATDDACTPIDVARARRLLRDMEDHPFIVFTFKGGKMHATTKGLDDSAVELVEQLLSLLTA